jgi:hypothetical protein
MKRSWLLLGFPAFLLQVPCARCEWQVWTLTETRHVRRDEAPGKEKKATLAAARNEWESFQILMRSGFPVQGINVEPGNLTGPRGAILPAARARLFRQHQLHITIPTYRHMGFIPGWYPDPLIPFQNPSTGKPLAKARFVAVPFDLPANQTHGFLADLFIPLGTPAGEYRGTYRVTAQEQQPVEVPVALTVWDFDLPPVPTMKTALGSPAHQLRSYYQKRAQQGKEKAPAHWDTVEAQCSQLLSEHRINATPSKNLWPVAQSDGTFRIPKEQIDAFRAFVDRYHLNALDIPHPNNAVKDPEKERTRLHAWLACWDRAIKELNRPQVVFYTYLLDEPNDPEAYRYVQKWGRIIREAHSLVKVMVVEQPQTQDPSWGDLYGAVDIWCPLFCLFEAGPAAKRQALGETIWTYTALCQGEKMTPWWHTDFPLLHYRVPAWIAWRYRIRGLLYWGSLSFWDHVEDPWINPETYDLRKESKGPVYIGEGSIVYPGRPVGYEGIASSLRLKALRDSIEDYEYLALLEQLGKAKDAEKVVLPLAGSWYRWDQDPAAFQKARARLAAMILREQ